MKEASGEANLTVITIILIAVVVAVATPLVNSLMKTSTCRACCTDSGGVWQSNHCVLEGSGADQNGYTTCAQEANAEAECQ